MIDTTNGTVRRASIVAATVATIAYMTYRGMFTLNLDGPYACFASLSLYLAEMYGCMLMFLYFFQIWELVEPEPVPPLENRTVDVFIPTYNEDPELLRGTVSAALALDYPHRTYILDDGNRPAVASLAAELGAEYIFRETNLHAKAGNLNHAMEITDGEFVVIFDADHVSRRDFITRLIGYFSDERMGFVQTPHSFYNFDNFHGTLNYKSKRYWEEGELFYNVIQPGKNYWNAVSFCGSAAIFRRAALEDVGLVATETITEDMHTGLRMHARGWNSLFVNERLVSGQAATDVTTFNTQRLRWGEGNLAVFAYDNPLTMRGLTLAQRLGYLGSMLSWTTGAQKLQLYIAPMLMLLTGVPPVNELSWTLGMITLLYMLSIWTAVTITANGHGHLIGTELTHMASFWTQIQAMYRAIFRRKKSKFVVTAKRGRQTSSIRRFIAPHCLYIAGCALAVTWAITCHFMGLSDDVNGLAVGSLLLLVNCWFAWQVIRRALRSKEDADDSWRHPCAIHVEYAARDSHGALVTGQAVSCDLNERGLGFHAFADMPANEEIRITLSAMGLATTCRGRIRYRTRALQSHSRRDGDASSWRYGVEFLEPSTQNLAVIWRICSDYATARLYEQFESRKSKRRVGSIETALAECSAGEQRINLPVTLMPRDGTFVASVTESMSARGCRLLFEHAPPPHQALQMNLATPLGIVSGTAKVRCVQPIGLGAAALELAELEFEKFEGESRSLLLSLCSASAEEKVSAVVRLRPPEKCLPRFRPAMLAGSSAVAAALLAMVSAIAWHQDDLLLFQAGQATIMTEALSARLDRMVDEVITDPVADEAHIVRLREILRRLDDQEGVSKLSQLLMQRELETFTAKLCRAQSLDGVHRYAEAWQRYASLLEEIDDASSEEERVELLLSAARNSANCNDFARAAELFGQIDVTTLDANPELRREYAGLLATAGQVRRGIELLLQQPLMTDADRILLGSMYSTAGQYRSAIELYREMLRQHPSDGRMTLLLADNAMWDKDYALAITHLERHLRNAPNDRLAQEKLAFSFLWNLQGTEAISMLESLLSQQANRQDLRMAFVEAASLSPRLSASQINLLSSIAAGHRLDSQNAEMSELLVNALSQSGRSSEVLPLLGSLVERYPQRMDLRVRLVDLLETAGDFESAERHLKVLIAATSPAGQHPSVGRLVVKASLDSDSTHAFE